MKQMILAAAALMIPASAMAGNASNAGTADQIVAAPVVVTPAPAGSMGMSGGLSGTTVALLAGVAAVGVLALASDSDSTSGTND